VYVLTGKVWSGQRRSKTKLRFGHYERTKELFPIVIVGTLAFEKREAGGRGRQLGGKSRRQDSDVSARERAHMRTPIRGTLMTWTPSTTISMNVSRACHDDDCTSRLTLGSTVAARSQPSRSSSTPALLTSASSRLQSRLPLAFRATAQPCPHLTISRGRGSSLRTSPLGPGSVAQAAVPVASPSPP
jgi:hypothetical protein